MNSSNYKQHMETQSDKTIKHGPLGVAANQSTSGKAMPLLDNRPQSLVQKKQADTLRYKQIAQLPIQKKGNGTVPSLSEVIQLVKVYDKPTREKGDGFDEDEMYGLFGRSAHGLTLEQEMGDIGFKYMGDTGSASKANTDIHKKEIRINKGSSPEVAALSFAYELRNASQHEEYKQTLEMPQKDEVHEGDEQLFTTAILRKEARSAFMRSKVALESGLQEHVVNKKYNEIVSEEGKTDKEKEEAILQEMIVNGKVMGGAKKATTHYEEMFFAEHEKHKAKKK